jgi:hypothetical protein
VRQHFVALMRSAIAVIDVLELDAHRASAVEKAGARHSGFGPPPLRRSSFAGRRRRARR